MIKRRLFHTLIFCLGWMCSYAQTKDAAVLTFDEYMGYVKKYHPLVKQANLLLEESQAKLMKARGAFDPKLAVDYDRKKFKSTEYYDKLNATFKIPTWFGIEFKGNFEENSGFFLNPEGNLPEDGLYNIGVSIPLARGLLTNKRMAMLRQAKLYREQAQAERQLEVNTIVYNASIVYFNWLKSYKDQQVYTTFVANAITRFEGIKKNYELGENAAIDTLEAGIILNNRKLAQEQARIVFIKSSLELSNFLWLENEIPVELQDAVIPDIQTFKTIDNVLSTTPLEIESTVLENHPKLRALDFKYKSQKIERRLQLNNLLPKVDLEYNFLSDTPDIANSFTTANYKSGLRLNFPLFLRKERGDLKLARLKLNAIEFDLISTKLYLENKFGALANESISYETQGNLTATIVQDYSRLLKAEERKFNLGESSLFLINSRESKLIEAELKAIDIENKFFKVKANLFQLVNPQI